MDQLNYAFGQIRYDNVPKEMPGTYNELKENKYFEPMYNTPRDKDERCAVCSKPAPKQSIQCKFCQQWYHDACVKLSKEHHVKKWNNSNMFWICFICEAAIDQFDANFYPTNINSKHLTVSHVKCNCKCHDDDDNNKNYANDDDTNIDCNKNSTVTSNKPKKANEIDIDNNLNDKNCSSTFAKQGKNNIDCNDDTHTNANANANVNANDELDTQESKEHDTDLFNDKEEGNNIDDNMNNKGVEGCLCLIDNVTSVALKCSVCLQLIPRPNKVAICSSSDHDCHVNQYQQYVVCLWCLEHMNQYDESPINM